MHVLPRAGISNQGYQSLSEELPRDGDPFSQTGPTELAESQGRECVILMLMLVSDVPGIPDMCQAWV
jgi:hypothetical protein